MTDLVHLQDNQSLMKKVEVVKKWRDSRRESQMESETEILADSLYGQRRETAGETCSTAGTLEHQFRPNSGLYFL